MTGAFRIFGEVFNEHQVAAGLGGCSEQYVSAMQM